MDFRNTYGGVFMLTVLYLTCTLGTIVLYTPTLPLMLINSHLSRRILDFLTGTWFLLNVAMYEVLMGVKVVVKGKPARLGTSSLIISNHRTRLDWLYFMSYLARYGSLQQFRISLKHSLKLIPGIGWAQQLCGFFFLHRNWNTDKEIISDGIEYFSRVKSKPQILLYPEGTDLTQFNIEKSNKFAEDKGYEKYEQVLHPKTAGFVHFVKEMRKGQILDSILDVTVAYPKNIVQDELSIAKGNVPEEVHFLVQDYPLETLPETDKELEQWCRDLWKKKEASLKRFYADKKFLSEDEGVSGAMHNPLLGNEVSSNMLYAVLAFWAVFLVLSISAFTFSTYFRYFCYLTAAVYAYVSYRYGIETLLQDVAKRQDLAVRR